MGYKISYINLLYKNENIKYVYYLRYFLSAEKGVYTYTHTYSDVQIKKD